MNDAQAFRRVRIDEKVFWLARSGDRDAMNDLLTSMRGWVERRAMRPPNGVDRDDAEGFAWEAAWLALRKCEVPETVHSFAFRAYGFLVSNHRKKQSRRPSLVRVDLDRLSASEVRFPEWHRPVATRRDPAAPCLRCGTTAGYRNRHARMPRRVHGFCNTCAASERKKRLAMIKP